MSAQFLSKNQVPERKVREQLKITIQNIFEGATDDFHEMSSICHKPEMVSSAAPEYQPK